MNYTSIKLLKIKLRVSGPLPLCNLWEEWAWARPRQPPFAPGRGTESPPPLTDLTPALPTPASCKGPEPLFIHSALLAQAPRRLSGSSEALAGGVFLRKPAQSTRGPYSWGVFPSCAPNLYRTPLKSGQRTPVAYAEEKAGIGTPCRT